MIDFKRHISDVADAFDHVSTLDFPLLVGNGNAGGNEQAIDNITISHLSHFSHLELSHLEPEGDDGEVFIENGRVNSRGTGDESKTVGTVGTVGNASNGNGLFFPPIISKVGKVGKDGLAGDTPSAPIPGPTDVEPDWVRDHAASLDVAAFDDNVPAAPLVVTGSYVRDERHLVAALGALRDAARVPSDWVEGVLSLSPDVAPCPGFRDSQWARTYTYIVHFMTGPLAPAAAALGWSTELLFGVHPTVGLANVSDCGACILADRNPIIEVERDGIRFERMTFYRPAARNLSAPVWGFGR